MKYRTKVVIVEDENTIRTLYSLKLRLEGFDVAEAANGVDGLKVIQSFTPDIVLLDLKMPVMSGDEMLEEMRKTDWGSLPRVVILTNISRDEAPHILRFLNVDKYIVKAHHTPAQIVETIYNILGTKKVRT